MFFGFALVESRAAIPMNFYSGSESKSESAISKVIGMAIGIGIGTGIEKYIFDSDWLKKHENSVVTVNQFLFISELESE